MEEHRLVNYIHINPVVVWGIDLDIFNKNNGSFALGGYGNNAKQDKHKNGKVADANLSQEVCRRAHLLRGLSLLISCEAQIFSLEEENSKYA